jgi:cytochrome c oxidase subunit 4
MAAETISPRIYTAVLAALVVLTVLTVGVSFLDLKTNWHLALGLIIAIFKASLVALFFMHVIHSSRSLGAVLVTTIFWATVVLVALTFTDYAMREAAPFTPGH